MWTPRTLSRQKLLLLTVFLQNVLIRVWCDVKDVIFLFGWGFFVLKNAVLDSSILFPWLRISILELQQILKRKLGFVKLLLVAGFPAVLTL